MYEIPLVLLDTRSGGWEGVGGIPLVERFLYHLNESGLDEVVILTSLGGVAHDLNRWRGKLKIDWVEAEQGIEDILDCLPRQAYLYLDAGHLIDPRLLRALLASPQTTLLWTGAEDRENHIVRAGLLRRSDFYIWTREGNSALVHRAVPLFPWDVDPFEPEIRGPVSPYFLEVRSDLDARKASRLLIRSQNKQVMDLPAQYVHPVILNALTAFLIRTPVSPDTVTILGAGIAFGIAWLFWHGHFLLGALLTFLVDILDGVDGMLARTKLQFSRLGSQEALLDYFCENSWYAAIGVGLNASAGAGSFPLVMSALMIGADTADNVFYTLAGRWYGKSIDLFGPFDRAFRRIAGRRNIYGSMFIVGFATGFPLQTFAVASLWAVITAFVHGVRLFRHDENETPSGPALAGQGSFKL